MLIMTPILSVSANPSTKLAASLVPNHNRITQVIKVETLLSLIAGFEQPSDGAIFVNGKRIDELAPAARPVTMMFQENNLSGKDL